MLEELRVINQPETTNKKLGICFKVSNTYLNPSS